MEKVNSVIITINGLKENSGKKTFALALANILARNGKRVLLADFDYKNPALALTYGITHNQRNTEGYIEQTKRFGSFDMTNFFISASHSETKQKDLKKQLDEVPTNIFFMTFSENFTVEAANLQSQHFNDWNTEQCFDYMERIVEELKEQNFDYRILILPVGADDMFNLPLVLASDNCINLFKFNVEQLEAAKRLLTTFDQQSLQKFKFILNETSKKVEQRDYIQMCSPLQLNGIIPFDDYRAINEINGVISSPLIDNVALNLAKEIGLEVLETKRKFFGK